MADAIAIHTTNMYHVVMNSNRSLRVTIPKELHVLIHQRAQESGVSFSQYIRNVLASIRVQSRADRSGNLVDTSVIIDDTQYDKLRQLADRMGDSSIRAALTYVLEHHATENGSGQP